jgi:penicillin-binding protein 1A
MEKVYADPKSGYTYGAFPKPWVKITKQYNCPSPRIVADTTSTDSTSNPIDTTGVLPVPAPTTPPENPENTPPNQ